VTSWNGGRLFLERCRDCHAPHIGMLRASPEREEPRNPIPRSHALFASGAVTLLTVFPGGIRPASEPGTAG
jgi:hypothetical protein